MIDFEEYDKEYNSETMKEEIKNLLENDDDFEYEERDAIWRFEGRGERIFIDEKGCEEIHINKIDVAIGTKLYEFCENEVVTITDLSVPNEYKGFGNNRRGSCVRIYLKSELDGSQRSVCIQFHKGHVYMKIENLEKEIPGWDVWRD